MVKESSPCDNTKTERSTTRATPMRATPTVGLRRAIETWVMKMRTVETTAIETRMMETRVMEADNLVRVLKTSVPKRMDAA
jgi:hypothetical protein